MSETQTRYISGKAEPKKKPTTRDACLHRQQIAGRVRFCRIALQYRIADIVDMFDRTITNNVVASWERYFGAAIEARYIDRIATCYNVSKQWLLDGTGRSGLPEHIDDSHIETPLSVPIRQAAGHRAKRRRRELGIDSTPLDNPLGISYFQLGKWEECLPMYRNPLEDAWEDALQVPRGWLRNITSEEIKAI